MIARLSNGLHEISIDAYRPGMCVRVYLCVCMYVWEEGGGRRGMGIIFYSIRHLVGGINPVPYT